MTQESENKELTKMSKHYSQKEANDMKDEIIAKNKAIDVFFDKYNHIRGSIYGLLDSEKDATKLVIEAMEKEDIIADPKYKEKVDSMYPEFCAVRDNYMKYLGRLELLSVIVPSIKKYLKPKRKEEDDDKK